MQSSHADFGQAGFPQQYGYAQTLSSVQSNSGHDMSKQVAAQPAMFSNAGGMPTAAQQHHQSMGGPVPSPQPNLVQQGQQLSRGNPLNMQTFYRQGVPRSIPNMNRNQITAVVNQTGQQPSSQYGHTVQMVQSPTFHPSFPPMIVNQMPQMYQPRQYSPQQYSLISPSQPLYLSPNNWNSYNNPPPQSSNNYFPSPGISTFNSLPPQMPQQQPPAQRTQQKTKAVAIINPNTGKSIFESGDESSSRPNLEKETENVDTSICIQFATQVAATLPNNRNEPSSKSSTVEETRVIDSQNVVLCPAVIEIPRSDEIGDSELGDAESLSDVKSLGDFEYIETRSISSSSSREDETVMFYKDNFDANCINKCVVYGNKTCTARNADSVPVAELKDPKVFEMVSAEPSYPEISEPIKTENVLILDSIAEPEIPIESSEVQEVIVQSVIDPDSSRAVEDDVVLPSVTAAVSIKEETKIPDCSYEVNEGIVPAVLNSKSSALSEGKKNKTKKKKDLNKKGESKEGGEMDAFLVSEDAAASPVDSPVQSVPTPVIERLPSPVTIVDSEILSTIPLPGEILDNFPQNDVSPSEPISDTSDSPTAESEDKENIVVEEPQSKIVLKYSYKEDQWSPLNPEGKKQYDRDFLIQMQSQPMSLCKPSNLPNLDVIKDKAHIQKLSEINRVVPHVILPMKAYNDPFMPQYARGGPPRLPHPAVNRRSQGRGSEKPKRIISFSSSLTQNVKLHESENAWKPNYKSETTDSGLELADKEKLKRSVQGVLNKLTPQKFETLLTQLKNLNIDTEEKLNVVIDLIFEKAIDEPNFSVPYANLCKHLALIKVPLANQPNQQVNFRKLLLTKCQKEFEQDRSEELKHEERIKAIEAAEPDKKKEMKLELDLEEKKLRYRQLGNIRFIGELFKLGMLIEPIMHECIKKLLTQGDEESLECLCRLLKTIGKELDDGKGSKNTQYPPMEMYFNQMQKIVDKRLTSSRVRFMLQDVVDLKKNNWVPRRDENMPKTIDQIHQEAEREAREQQQTYQNMAAYPKRMPDDRDRRKPNNRNPGQSEDGWTSSSKTNKGSYSIVDPMKLKLTKPDEVESIRLGPGGRGLQSWGRGSSGGTKTSVDTDVKTALTNRYSALAEQPLTTNYEGRRGSQRSAASSRESSRGRNNQLPPAIRKTPSTSKERENLLETVKGLSRAIETKTPEIKTIEKQIDVQLNGKAADSDELALRGPEWSEEDMEKKTTPLIDEFLHNNDFEEAIKCVTELASPITVHMFINDAINQVLERSSQARYSLGQLLFSLFKKKIITFEQYKKGFASVLGIIDDYALDIPLIWEYIGEIIEPMIEDTEFPLLLLKEVLLPCIPSETAGKLVSAILHCAAKRKGTIKLGEVWRESGLQWSDFLGSDYNISEFIQKYKLEFTICPTKVTHTTQMTIEEISQNLTGLLEKSKECEEIFDWIDANVSENTEPNFIRALVTAVHEDAILGSAAQYDLEQSKLKKWTTLLTRYIDHKENLELQALHAIQALMNKLGHPNGLLRQIFDILYDDDVITEDTFKQWEQSDDPNEAGGKGVAVHSVKSFFTWLRESESAEEEAEE